MLVGLIGLDGLTIWKLLPFLFVLATGLLFPVSGLIMTLVMIFETELDFPNFKLFVTIEPIYVTSQTAMLTCDLLPLCCSGVSDNGHSCLPGRGSAPEGFDIVSLDVLHTSWMPATGLSTSKRSAD